MRLIRLELTRTLASHQQLHRRAVLFREDEPASGLGVSVLLLPPSNCLREVVLSETPGAHVKGHLPLREFVGRDSRLPRRMIRELLSQKRCYRCREFIVRIVCARFSMPAVRLSRSRACVMWLEQDIGDGIGGNVQ